MSKFPSKVFVEYLDRKDSIQDIEYDVSSREDAEKVIAVLFVQGITVEDIDDDGTEWIERYPPSRILRAQYIVYAPEEEEAQE